MSLRSLAESDLSFVLEDENAFGWPIKITSPDLASLDLSGQSNDISQVIDPDTGMLVAGRLATVTIRTSRLLDAGMAMPRAIADSSSKPWVVEFSDINGRAYTFKVSSSMPDRALGTISMTLEAYD